MVDTVETAQWCIEFLKKHNIGRAVFIALEKQEYLRQRANSQIQTYVFNVILKYVYRVFNFVQKIHHILQLVDIFIFYIEIKSFRIRPFIYI